MATRVRLGLTGEFLIHHVNCKAQTVSAPCYKLFMSDTAFLTVRITSCDELCLSVFTLVIKTRTPETKFLILLNIA